MMREIRERMMRHPAGFVGRLGGWFMIRMNGEQERRLVGRAALEPGERVLVVGPGPGMGVSLVADAIGPTGLVVAVDPSAVMRIMTADRCARAVGEGVVAVREGTAERTGCDDATMDVAISVNNVTMWDRQAGFAEMARIVRPGGRLLIEAHRHVLDVPLERVPAAAEELRNAALQAGFRDVVLTTHQHKYSDQSVELIAYR
jgi:arsenite methyltransferase